MLKTAFRRIKTLFTRVHDLHTRLDNLPFYMQRIAMEKTIFSENAPSGVTDRQYFPYPVIVSLTSYGRRLLDVCFAVESIMQQSWRPNRIVLWLDPDDVRNLPEALVRQQKRGLEIRERNPFLRSYNKLLPMLDEAPEAAIITIDDDAVYDFDLVERLIKAHKANPRAIYSPMSREMTLKDGLNLASYNKWDTTSVQPGNETIFTFFMGGSGTLYPPNSLDPRVKDASAAMRCAPTADDVWFNVAAHAHHTPVCKIPTRNPDGMDFVTNRNYLDNGLAIVNEGQGGNDAALVASQDFFGIPIHGIRIVKD